MTAYPIHIIDSADFQGIDDYLSKMPKLVLFLSHCANVGAIIYGILPRTMSWLVTDEAKYAEICQRYELSAADFIRQE